ncbi:MAG: hypothetical protein Q4G58_15780 [bacterium]|nr:hypothetical protein [bacterium]
MGSLKKCIGILMLIMLCSSFVACGGKSDETNVDTTPNATTNATVDTQKKSATLYVDFSYGSENPTPQQKQTYNMDYSGELTPQMLCDGLSKLTGLDFTAKVTKEKKGIWVEWEEKSSLITGLDDRTLKKEFTFSDEDSMRWFMMDSLWQTLIENFGLDIYYTQTNGETLVLKGLKPVHTFEKDTAYKGSTYYFTNVKKAEATNPAKTSVPELEKTEVPTPKETEAVKSKESSGFTQQQAFDYLADLVSPELKKGMALMQDYEDNINGEHCWTFILGENTPDHFVGEKHFAVSENGKVYLMEIVSGEYQLYEPD